MSDDGKMRRNLPVTWSQGSMAGEGKKMEGKGAVVAPNEREVAIFSEQRVKTCGSCKFYRLEIQQREFKKTQGSWFKELVHDLGWKIRHLGAHPRDIARCGQKDEVLVGPNSRACEFHKDYSGGINR